MDLLNADHRPEFITFLLRLIHYMFLKEKIYKSALFLFIHFNSEKVTLIKFVKPEFWPKVIPVIN